MCFVTFACSMYKVIKYNEFACSFVSTGIVVGDCPSFYLRIIVGMVVFSYWRGRYDRMCERRYPRCQWFSPQQAAAMEENW